MTYILTTAPPLDTSTFHHISLPPRTECQPSKLTGEPNFSLFRVVVRPISSKDDGEPVVICQSSRSLIDSDWSMIDDDQ